MVNIRVVDMVLYTVGVVAMVNIRVVAMVLYIQCEWLLWFYIYSVSGCYGFIYSGSGCYG